MDELISGTKCLEETNKCEKDDTLKNSCKKESFVEEKIVSTVTDQKKRKLTDITSDVTECKGKKITFNFKPTMPPKKRLKGAKPGHGTKGLKIGNCLPTEDQDQCKEEILLKFKEYIKNLSRRNWDDLVAKASYVRGTAGRRAGMALDKAMDEEQLLLSVLQNSIPSHINITKPCLVELLFTIIARMVNEGHLILEKDPKRTSENVQKEMLKLINVLKQSGLEKDHCEKIAVAKNVEDSFMEELREEGLLKTSIYMLKKNQDIRYDVCGEILEGRDMKTLEGTRWLNDKVMNAYLGILRSEKNLEDDGHIFTIPSYMTVLWERGRFDTWFYRKVMMKRYTWVFMPINKGQNHWILLVANIPEMSVSILDSMNGNNQVFIENWRKYMEARGKEVGELNGPWKNGNILSSQQRDGHSCGPFALMNALALSKGIMPSSLSQKCASMMRQYVTAKIVEAAKRPKAQRTICDMLECKKPNKDSWAQCEVCGRWLHFTCVSLKIAPANDYVCIICDSQYK